MCSNILNFVNAEIGLCACSANLKMTKKCCVPLCKSNYCTTAYYVTVFTFPSDTDLRDNWKQCIPRIDWSPSKSTLMCSKYFYPCDMILSETFTDKMAVNMSDLERIAF